MYTQIHPQQMYEVAQQRHDALVAACEKARMEQIVKASPAYQPNSWLAKALEIVANVGHGRRPRIQSAV